MAVICEIWLSGNVRLCITVCEIKRGKGRGEVSQYAVKSRDYMFFKNTRKITSLLRISAM